MSVPSLRKRFNRVRFSTLWAEARIDRRPAGSRAGAWTLFLLASAATLTIWIRDPLAAWGYECAAFVMGAWLCWRDASWRRQETRRESFRGGAIAAAVGAISIWGFAQAALGATVYKYATLDASLHWSALGATAFAAAGALGRRRPRRAFLRVLAWFGFVVSVVAVLEYYTSSGRVFWVFDSGYPDAWGPFLSRNNFAEFLELVLPVALWLAFDDRRRIRDFQTSALKWTVLYRRTQENAGWTVVLMPATILAAGLASASRAGASVLVLETAVVTGLLWRRGRRVRWAAFQLAMATGVLAAVAGAGQLGRRMLLPDPFAYRREMAGSALAMIAARPFQGFGLGTFQTVYPAYATFDAGAIVDHAHNDWLEWAAEGGLPFGILWAGLVAAVTPLALRSVWGVGVPAVFLHAAVDYPFARLGVAAWVFVLIGALWADRGGGHERGDSDARKEL